MEVSDLSFMLNAAGQALVIMSDPMRLSILFLGALLGVILGIVPGIGTLAGFALVLPFTYVMDSYSAFALLLGLAATVSISDTIPAVLFGVPGSNSAQATVLDGLPMAKKGEAGRALSASYAASLVGGLFAALFMVVTVPILRPVILNVGTPEMAAVAILGLTMVAALSGNAPLRGLAAACIGIIIAMIGIDPRTGTFRWVFGNLYLWDGLPLVPMALGLFALPELADLVIGRRSMTQKTTLSMRDGMVQGLRDVLKSWWLIFRCSGIGAAVGALPGVGGSVIGWLAYGHAARSEKGASETFGTGDVRGVIAPESANNASEGGSVLVTVALGIPGSAAMAILLGAFVAHGLAPGPEMLSTNLHVTYSMVWSLAVANIVGAGLCFAFSGYFAKIATLRYTLILPTVLSVVYVGAFAGSRSWGDLFALLFFGVLGWTMKRLKWPRPPLILGIVLGGTVEGFVFLSARLYGWTWLLHPIVLVVLGIAVWGVLRPILKRAKEERRQFGHRPKRGAPKLALPDLFAVVLIGAMGYLLYLSTFWSSSSALVPTIVCIVGIVAVIGSVIQSAWERAPIIDGSAARAKSGVYMDIATDDDNLANRTIVLRAVGFFGWLVGFMASMAVVGLIVTIPIFVIAYMRIEGRERWRLVVAQAICITLFAYFVFDRLLNLPWPPTWMGATFPELARYIPAM